MGRAGRRQALSIEDDFERIGREYAGSAKAEQCSSTVGSLVARRQPADTAFARLVEEVIRIRQSLLDTLSPEEWNDVFG